MFEDILGPAKPYNDVPKGKVTRVVDEDEGEALDPRQHIASIDAAKPRRYGGGQVTAPPSPRGRVWNTSPTPQKRPWRTN